VSSRNGFIKNRLPDAIAEYNAALRLKPGLAPPTRELAERRRATPAQNGSLMQAR